MTRQEQSPGFGATHDLTLKDQTLFPPGSSHPQWRGKFGETELEVFAQSVLDTSNRVRVPDMRGFQRIYSGDWFCQGDKMPTCTVWSIANAARVVGVSPDDALLRNLLDFAQGVGRAGQVGMSMTDAKRIMRNHPNPGFELGAMGTLITAEKGVVGMLTKYNERFGGSSEPAIVRETIIRDNFNVIQHQIDAGNAVIVSVWSSELYKNDSKRSHALCVAGYRVDSSGLCDLQIVNSARGVMWIGVEHVCESLMQDFNAHVLKKAC